ncbi:MAG: SDR family oxidoreductase [Gammaproteobacteria bacterium]|nr:SDR family oxidoreductase [Gammaproteobacteria bacterium]
MTESTFNQNAAQGLGVLVTAAGSGIGQAVARVMAEAGASVFICDIDEQALKVTAESNPMISGLVADVSDPKQVEELFNQARETIGCVDVLVNNAGIGGPHGPVEECSIEEWNQTINVNLSGMFYCVKQAVPAMKKQNRGCIINVSTGSVTTALPNRTPYVASKAGVQGFTRSLARELGPWNIRCNAILPGAIDNERGRNLVKRLAEEKGKSFVETEEEFLKYISMRTWIDPREIGETMLFLSSHAGRHITGQEIGVCGNIEWEE